jgi:hypothetical protein
VNPITQLPTSSLFSKQSQTKPPNQKRKQVNTGAYWRPIKEKKKAGEVSDE